MFYPHVKGILFVILPKQLIIIPYYSDIEAVEELESLASQGLIDSVVEGSTRILGISRKPDRFKRFVLLGFLKSEFFDCLRY